jgi:hypothetical protein
MYIGNPSASFTRPADITPYSANDLIANSTTAGSVLPLTLTTTNLFGTSAFRLTRARLTKSGTTPPSSATIRIHLYQSAAPTVTNGDNGAFSTAGGANWLGNIDVTSMVAFTDGCTGIGSAAAGSEMYIKAASGTQIFAYLQVLAAYTPISGEVFTLTLEELDAY